MTLPASGPISLNAVNVELQQTATGTISLNDTKVRTLFGVASGAISMSNGYGKAYTVAGNSGVLTAGTSYTLPSTSGLTINVLVIGAGAGGGGGSGRTSYSGYFTGGGGGGSGAAVYATSIAVTPGQTISFSIGSGGAAGATRDGVYSSGSDGTAGATTAVTVNGTVVASAGGGVGGLVSPNATGGSGGSAITGTVLSASTAGGTAGSGTTYGGLGAKGYNINTTVGTAVGSLLTYGNSGVTYPEGSSSSNTPGTGYGAGGSGGSTVQSDVYPYYPDQANAGLGGAVFIWWGY